MKQKVTLTIKDGYAQAKFDPQPSDEVHQALSVHIDAIVAVLREHEEDES